MKRDQLEHVIRAAAAVTGETEFIIIGSQSVLGAAPSAPTMAPELCMSLEADMYPRRRPDLYESIEGALGRGSDFDATCGYYVDGVGQETAKLPSGWEVRLIRVGASWQRP